MVTKDLPGNDLKYQKISNHGESPTVDFGWLFFRDPSARPQLRTFQACLALVVAGGCLVWLVYGWLFLIVVSYLITSWIITSMFSEWDAVRLPVMSVKNTQKGCCPTKVGDESRCHDKGIVHTPGDYPMLFAAAPLKITSSEMVRRGLSIALWASPLLS